MTSIGECNSVKLHNGLCGSFGLSHDMANIAVYLPRQVPVDVMIIISIIFVAGLAYMFYERGVEYKKLY